MVITVSNACGMIIYCCDQKWKSILQIL